jgi:hypothetical protein
MGEEAAYFMSTRKQNERDEEACVPFLPSRAHFHLLNFPTLCLISQILPSSFKSAVGW